MLIRSKLSMAFGAISLLACGAGGVALLINSGVRADVAQIIQGSVDKPKAAEGMSESLLNIRLHWQERAAQGNTSTLGVSGGNMGEAVARDVKYFEQYLAECRDVTARSVQLAVAEEAAEEIEAAEHEVEVLEAIRGKFATLKGLLEATNTSPTTSGVALIPVWKPQHEAIAALVQSYKIGAENELNSEVRAVDRSLRHANQIILWSTLALFLLASLLAWLIARAFSRPLALLAVAVRRIGEGHLDTAVAFDSKDEFGILAQAFNRMSVNLQTTTVSRDYVEGILKSMASSLIVVRPDQTIKSVNDSTLKMLGYTESELIGQTLKRVLRTPGASPQAILDEAALTGVSDVEFVYQTKTGLLLPVSFSAAVLRDVSGAMEGFVCVAQDISERKQAQAEVEAMNRRLVDSSRQAGMAEVATSVLHNVGNVLNSVNVSTTIVADQVRKSKAGNLAKAMALMNRHALDLGEFLTNDPKGKQLPGYLTQLAGHLGTEQSTLLKEMEQLRKNIEHIKDIVAMQQSYAKVSGVTETLNISDLVEDALRMNAGALTRHEVEVVRDYGKIPPVTIDKHKVLQVLVNLIRNAKYACDDSGRTDKRMTIRVADGEGRLKIAIIDNGVGILPENLMRIFNHGFTTREQGHGFGLHSGSLAAKEMGGTLIVQSDGPGRGAAFTLELPFTPNRDAHE